MNEQERKAYMTQLWGRIVRGDAPDMMIECMLLNFESKLFLGWPDPR